MRKQTLDLAQQAQAAAYLYLGFDPHETNSWNIWQKTGDSRPVEVHLHHHHHHYYMEKPGGRILCENREPGFESVYANSNAHEEFNTKRLYIEGEPDYSEHASTKALENRTNQLLEASKTDVHDGGELNNLIRNFSKLLDSKLKEETLVKVTQAIAAVIDEEATSYRRESPTMDDDGPSRFPAYGNSKCSHTRNYTCINGNDAGGYQPALRQQNVLEGYSNVYVSPVFEDQRRYGATQVTTASEKTREESASLMYISYEQKNKVQQRTEMHPGVLYPDYLGKDILHENARPKMVATSIPEQGELRNLEAAVQNLGIICQEHEQKVESLNFGNKDQQDVKDMRNHYLSTLKGMSKNVTELHRNIEEEKEASCSNCWNNHSKVLALTAVIKSKDEALNCAEELNQRLSNEISKTESSLAVLRIHCTSLQESLQAEVEESKSEMQALQEQTSKMKQELLAGDARVSGLEHSLAEKEKELQQVKQKASFVTFGLEQSLAEKDKQTLKMGQEILSNDAKTSGLERSLAEKEAELEQVKQKASSMAYGFEQSLAEKDREIQQAKQKVSTMQKQADNTLLEKYEAVRKMHEYRKDADEQRQRVDELVSINDELLVFARSKETEISNQQTSLRGVEDENTKLKKELEILRSEVKDQGSLFLECGTLHAKLAETEFELAQREEALKRMSLHLASNIEAQDSAMEEHARLQNVRIQKDSTIQDLELKLSRVEEQLVGARDQINGLKREADKQGRDDGFSLLNDSEDTSWRIQQLEEELMEKEGQIAILKSSFRDQYDSMY